MLYTLSVSKRKLGNNMISLSGKVSSLLNMLEHGFNAAAQIVQQSFDNFCGLVSVKPKPVEVQRWRLPRGLRWLVHSWSQRRDWRQVIDAEMLQELRGITMVGDSKQDGLDQGSANKKAS
jgi:hypothetical protein